MSPSRTFTVLSFLVLFTLVVAGCSRPATPEAATVETAPAGATHLYAEPTDTTSRTTVPLAPSFSGQSDASSPGVTGPEVAADTAFLDHLSPEKERVNSLPAYPGIDGPSASLTTSNQVAAESEPVESPLASEGKEAPPGREMAPPVVESLPDVYAANDGEAFNAPVPAGPAGAAVTKGQSASQSAGPSPSPAPATGARGGGGGQSQPWATTFFDNPRTATVHTSEDAVSTFSLDTDRTSYRLALNWARQGYLVDPDSVRAEEWINSFDYGYEPPTAENEFGIYFDVFEHPLDESKHLARIAFQAPHLPDDAKPLNVTLVLDASGSMAEGNRVEIARAAAESLRRSLREQDRIAVVQFSQGVLNRLTVKHTHPDDRDVGRSINRLRPNGSTNVQAGLDLGMKLADRARRQRPDAHNYIVLMSDGVANVDATNPFAILETAGDYERQNPVRLITIGLGIANYNDYLLEQLAQHGNGWYRYLDRVSQAESLFERDSWLSLATPFADQARAQVTWDPKLVRTWRIVGYENRVAADEHFSQDRKEFAEIPSGAATTVFYELELYEQGDVEWDDWAKLGDIQLRWVDPGSGASLRQHAPVSGGGWQTFDGLRDPMLKLGGLVALAADWYSALPGVHNLEYGAGNEELGDLRQKLRSLGEQLDHLTAYEDLVFLLDHMAWRVPFEPGGFTETGYSP